MFPGTQKLQMNLQQGLAAVGVWSHRPAINHCTCGRILLIPCIARNHCLVLALSAGGVRGGGGGGMTKCDEGRAAPARMRRWRCRVIQEGGAEGGEERRWQQAKV